MSIVVHVENPTLTTSGGTISTTINVRFNKCRQIIVIPATASTTFDVKITDIYSVDTYHRKALTKKLNDQVELLTYGNWTFTIENASADEAFTCLLVFEES